MKSDKAKYIVRVVAALAISTVFFVHERYILWHITESVNVRVGYRTGEVPHKGDYATFLKSFEIIKDGKELRLTKKFKCGPGDYIKTVGRALYCNDDLLGVALDRTGSGKPLYPFQWDGPIPEGKAFMLGDTEDSFDSRYWGFMDINKLEKVKAII